jgi:hypothetical protein
MSIARPIVRDLRRRDIVAAPGQVLFDLPVDVFAAEDVALWRRVPPATSFTRLTTGFTVAAITSFPGAARATFTVAPHTTWGAGVVIRIESRRTAERTTDVVRAGVVESVAIELELDRQTTVDQELRRDVDDLGGIAVDAANARDAAAASATAAAGSAASAATSASGIQIQRLLVLSRTTVAAPASPAPNDRYILTAGATGAWAGQPINTIARCSGTGPVTWSYTAPTVGALAFINDTLEDRIFNGSTWAIPSVALADKSVTYSKIQDVPNREFLLRLTAGTGVLETTPPATVAQLRAAIADRPVMLADLYAAAAYVALTYGATTAWDVATGIHFTLTLTGNTTISTPTNMVVGKSGVLRVIQDATGSRLITWPAAIVFGGNRTLPVLSTAANAVDVFSYTSLPGGQMLLAPVALRVA